MKSVTGNGGETVGSSREHEGWWAATGTRSLSFPQNSKAHVCVSPSRTAPLADAFPRYMYHLPLLIHSPGVCVSDLPVTPQTRAPPCPLCVPHKHTSLDLSVGSVPSGSGELASGEVLLLWVS